MAKARAPTALAQVAGRLHHFEGEPLRAAFLARSIDALTKVAERLDRAELGRVIALSSNEATLLTALAQPGAVGLFSAADPLTPARIRGLWARDALLAAEGGALSAEEAGALLHITRQAV